VGPAPYASGQEIEVLEENQKADVTEKAEIEIEPAKTLLLCLLNLQAGKVIQQGDAPDHKDVSGAPAHIEVVAGDENNDSSHRAPRAQDEGPHQDKENQELKAIEEHAVVLS
jgi:hypothetical protein